MGTRQWMRPYPPGMSGELTPAQFMAKWSKATLPGRAASGEHFIDLCRMLGQPTPGEHDATGAECVFERGVPVTGSSLKGSRGARGLADVWRAMIWPSGGGSLIRACWGIWCR